MKARRKIAGQNWKFDGSTITVRIPMAFKRQGGRKVIIAPDGSDAWVQAKPRRDETLIRALARAHRWKRLLEEGHHDSIIALANAENINRAYVCRLLNLTLLAPDITESILDGTHPRSLILEDVVRAMPSAWSQQRTQIGACCA